MALEVYYPTDIRNALLAAEQAANDTATATGNTGDPLAAAFLSGYLAALTTVALAFGLRSQADVSTRWPVLALSQRGVSWEQK